MKVDAKVLSSQIVPVYALKEDPENGGKYCELSWKSLVKHRVNGKYDVSKIRNLFIVAGGVPNFSNY